MSSSRRSRYSSRSPSPYHRYHHRSRYSRSVSRTPSTSRSRSRSYDSDAVNPGNNLYVTGLSSHVSKGELEDHFAREGKVVDIHLVVDPYTRESRGFGFVTMANVRDAERCIRHFDGSMLDGRVITVEKAKRGRGRTPTPGRYLGLRITSAGRRHRSSSYSPAYYRRRHQRSSSNRERSYSPYNYREYGRRRSPPYDRQSPTRRRRRYGSSLERSRSRSLSPYYSRRSASTTRMRRRYSRSISPAVKRRSSRKGHSRESYSHSRSFSPHSTGSPISSSLASSNAS